MILVARYTREQAVQAITDTLNSAGGTLTHNELIEALENSGNVRALEHLINATANGDVKAQVIAVEPGVNELRYSVGGGD